jgi:hypothetical protein
MQQRPADQHCVRARTHAHTHTQRPACSTHPFTPHEHSACHQAHRPTRCLVCQVAHAPRARSARHQAHAHARVIACRLPIVTRRPTAAARPRTAGRCGRVPAAGRGGHWVRCAAPSAAATRPAPPSRPRSPVAAQRTWPLPPAAHPPAPPPAAAAAAAPHPAGAAAGNKII